MAKKISTAFALAAFGLLISISQVDIVNAANLTAGAVTNNAYSVKEVISITDIVKPYAINDSKEVSLKPGRYSIEPVRWSPDGGRILIRSVVGWSQSEEVDEVYVMNADGTGLKKIVLSRFINSKGARIAFPTWIQGGEKIAFLLNRPNASLVVVVNPDGTGLRAIGTNLSDMESILAYLPDAGHWQGLYIEDINEFTTVTADGMNLENILKEKRKTNAEKIIFVESSNYSLYTMNPDGTGKTLLALTGWGEFFQLPVYALNPSGDKIVFSAIIDPATGKQMDFETLLARSDSYARSNSSAAHIFLSNPDGTERVQLTSKEPYNVITGGWSPDGSRIIVASSHDIEMRARNISIIKLSGYDEVLSIYSPGSIKQGDVAFIEIKSMSKPVENATILLNGREIGSTNEKGFLNHSFKEAGNFRLSAVKQGFRTANKPITVQESPSEQLSPEPTLIATPQITEFARVNLISKAQGFDMVLAIGVISTINLFKRRHN
ncbi:MAG: PEGA domain-containing protein [Candidatus Methanoperedens sp.]|nr:PEGA domain-containing protein [Candidatus Methanoperedens sp.]